MRAERSELIMDGIFRDLGGTYKFNVCRKGEENDKPWRGEVPVTRVERQREGRDEPLYGIGDCVRMIQRIHESFLVQRVDRGRQYVGFEIAIFGD